MRILWRSKEEEEIGRGREKEEGRGTNKMGKGEEERRIWRGKRGRIGEKKQLALAPLPSILDLPLSLTF
jgi:hypothetical protein